MSAAGTGWWLRSGCTRAVRLPVAVAASVDLFATAYAAGWAEGLAQAREEATEALRRLIGGETA